MIDVNNAVKIIEKHGLDEWDQETSKMFAAVLVNLFIERGLIEKNDNSSQEQMLINSLQPESLFTTEDSVEEDREPRKLASTAERILRKTTVFSALEKGAKTIGELSDLLLENCDYSYVQTDKRNCARSTVRDMVGRKELIRLNAGQDPSRPLDWDDYVKLADALRSREEENDGYALPLVERR